MNPSRSSGSFTVSLRDFVTSRIRTTLQFSRLDRRDARNALVQRDSRSFLARTDHLIDFTRCADRKPRTPTEVILNRKGPTIGSRHLPSRKSTLGRSVSLFNAPLVVKVESNFCLIFTFFFFFYLMFEIPNEIYFYLRMKRRCTGTDRNCSSGMIRNGKFLLVCF